MTSKVVVATFDSTCINMRKLEKVKEILRKRKGLTFLDLFPFNLARIHFQEEKIDNKNRKNKIKLIRPINISKNANL